MSVSLVVGVTDGSWFNFLRQMQNLPEVNFWSPSGRMFRSLQTGELFLFKLHAPRNYIVGGGIFVHSTILPCSLAWETFGEANGAKSEQDMRKIIIQYRNADPDDRGDFSIGCRILTQPFFLDESDWFPAPVINAPTKCFRADEEEGSTLWKAVKAHLESDAYPPILNDNARFGAPHLIQSRLGQGAFRAKVTDNYARRCAVTQERTLPALEAAHIKPYRDHGGHDVQNGLLLRRDIHSLFDTGYVTVTPDHHFEVSDRIREEFENGRHYYDLHGRQISLPKDSRLHPDPDALSWHNENCFRG